ncbi:MULTISPECIES: recombinase family protein [Flavobacterium]|uniref:Recombinase family protein n=1 Tax=Flavobacterium keumense TaxID=1306518 RepID=A0ABY8N691_9FLAO|nr:MULTISPECIES: recombinase family protein [Flavobacterium]WGK95160.1 recombinase family protein [Flavobacterium keumense]
MKNVILYVRVSTDEQAGRGYSLRDQEQKLITYCQNNNFNVLRIFREDYSAKTFKRPEFKKLLEFCKKNKKEIHQLLFIKWDRFSRNTAESYQMIGVFNELAIQVNAIEQPLDLSIPEQGLMLAVYLSMPEVENQRRSLNVISGMRRAFKEGRYVGYAPKGYDNGKDAAKKPILIPNEDARFVQEAFELMATGNYQRNEVFYKLKEKGFKSSKTAFANILNNHLYYGGVFIKAYKDEKETIVNGIHEPIITKALFDKVQQVMNNRKRGKQKAPKVYNDNFPLKGFLHCPICNKQMRASTSKGRTQYYSYYHCVSPCKGRYTSEEVHQQVTAFLADLSFDKQFQELYFEIIKEKLLEDTNRKVLGPKHHENVKSIEDKLVKVQDLYIDGGIDKSGYESAKERYENLLADLKSKEISSEDNKKLIDLYSKATKKFINIDIQYNNSDLEQKRKIIGSIFEKNIQFENKKVRTANLNPILSEIASINRGLQGKMKKGLTKKSVKPFLAPPLGLEPRTL